MNKSTAPFHVVVGFDFSPMAELALREAAAIAGQGDRAAIHVVNVLEAGRHRVTQPKLEEVELETESRLEAATEAAVRAVGDAGKVEIVAHVLRGDAAAQIVSLADDVEADLVIVGTHGHGGVRRLLLGSVADKVMRTSACPVLVMRPRRYDAHPELVPEPPCPVCVAVREESDGEIWWCEEHARRRTRPHRYSYQGSAPRPYHADGLGPG